MTTIVDHHLVERIRRYGRFDVNGCMNCGTCSIVCDLAAGPASFPRRPLQRALLGLTGPLVQGLEPWLCHDCGDCSRHCPRQAEPLASISTLRRFLAGRYDLTGLSRLVLRSGVWHAALLAAAAILFLAAAAAYHLYYVELAPADLLSTEMGLEHMFGLIQDVTAVLFLAPLAVMALNVLHMHRLTMRGDGRPAIPLRLYAQSLPELFRQMVGQPTLRQCLQAADPRRWGKHAVLASGFVLMSVIVLFFLPWFQTDALYPLYHPQRWLGYLATAALLIGPLDMIANRLRQRGEHRKFSEPADYALPLMLVLVALSGIAVHLFRYAGLTMGCHYAYALHMAVVAAMLLVEMPFGKMSHAVYRPFAIYFQAVLEAALSGAGAHASGQPIKEVAA